MIARGYNNKEIENIKYAEVHKYIPLKFNTDINFETLYNRLKNSKVTQSDEFLKIVDDVFYTHLFDAVDHMNKNMPDDVIKFRLKVDKEKSFDINHNKEIASLLLDPLIIDSNNLNMIFINNLIFNIQSRADMTDQEFEFLSKISNKFFINSQQRLFLLPSKLFLENEEEVWLIPQLIFFSNKMAFMKLEITLPNIKKNNFMENCIDEYVKNIKLINMEKVIEFSCLDDMVEYLLNQLQQDIDIEILKFESELSNIIFIDFDDMPNDLNKLSSGLKEDIYLILSAPVSDYEEQNYKDESNKFVEKQCSLFGKDVKFYLKTNGGCLTLISKKLLEMQLELNEGEINTEKDKQFLYKKIAVVLNSNCEIAFLLNMMKRMNNSLYLFDRLKKSTEYSKRRQEYNANIIYINQMLEGCYGTVIEHVEDFEKKMPLYHNTKLSKESSDAIDRIIYQRETEKNEKFQNFISIMGVVFVVVFGLPTIYETLTILRNLFPTGNLIPILTIENCSIGSWLLILCWIYWKLKFNIKADKD